MIPPVSALGSGWSVGSVGGLSPSDLSTTGASSGVSAGASAGEGATALPSGEEGSFGGALTNAISSLESSQRTADAASQGLATGTVADPESAVVSVQDAQLEMQLAAQIRTKATEAAQTIFQTQV
jgi:flagellar hook-basal body complex protein FliE